MDTSEAAFEAEVELDGQALWHAQQRRKHQSAQAATVIAKGGVTVQVGDDDGHDEQSPLLANREGEGSEGEEQDKDGAWDAASDFAHLPWWRRPSIFWMIGPFFIVACAFGGIIAPKLNLILDLICREYITDRMLLEPGFTRIPVDFNGGNNDQCRIPEVQSRVAQFTLWASLISGLLAAFSSPKLGALSDRYGRKPILILSSIGTVLGEIITIFAAKYPEKFPVTLLLLSYALDGMTGSFIVAMSISNAYATDCTPPKMRNVAFGYFHGCLFTGIALGPLIAAQIVKYSGQIVTIFYVLTAVHGLFIVFVALCVPESLSKKRQVAAREIHWSEVAKKGPEWDLVNSMRALNILEPLKILHPTGPGTSRALRRNLLVLAIVDTISFGVAMGSMMVVVIYTNYQFGWRTPESGQFMSIVNSCRVVCLVLVLPVLTRVFRGKVDPNKQKNTGSDMFDLTLIRVAIVLDTLGYLGYTLARTGAMFTLSGAVAAIGGIASPTLQSALTNSVPADKTGQLLGAIGLLHALARVVGPTVFNAIYSATVGKFTQTVFVCLCATFGLACVASWFIRPHVFFDDDAAAQAVADGYDEHDGDAAEQAEHDRVPIVSAVTAAFGTILVWLNLRS